MYNDIYDDEPDTWTFQPPETCNLKSQKLFDLRPYYGPRLNLASLVMGAQPHKMRIKGLSDIQVPLPVSFSWRKTGGEMIEQGGLRDQGKCGGCWAFATVSALGDRYALKYKIKSPYPSSAWLISSGKPPSIPSNMECLTGGNSYIGSKWAEINGIKLEECWPYSIIRNHNFVSPTPLSSIDDNCCVNCCGEQISNVASVSLKVKKDSTKYVAIVNDNGLIDAKGTIDAIKKEIMLNGPVVSSFAVYDDFISYWANHAKNGEIYIRQSDNFDGGHAVVLTGWGIENNIEYWEMRNSWGNTGDEGYCKIAMSTSIPVNSWCQIDLPTNINGQYTGGVISFLPDELPKSNLFIKIEDKPKIKTEPGKNNKGNDNKDNMYIFYTILGVLVLIIILFLLYNHFKQEKPKYNKVYSGSGYKKSINLTGYNPPVYYGYNSPSVSP
jgi:hypothetical protein